MNEYLGNFFGRDVMEPCDGEGGGGGESVHTCVEHVTCGCYGYSGGSGCGYVDNHDTHF